MSNYFDNQSSYSWKVSQDSVLVTTDHGDHTHTLDITNVPIGEIVDNTGKVMGEAHRAASHDYKASNISTEKENNGENNMSERSTFLESLKVDRETQEKLQTVLKDYNSSERKGKEKVEEGGRERGDDGPAKYGRESDLKATSKVSKIRTDIKSNPNTNSMNGQTGKKGKAIISEKSIVSKGNSKSNQGSKGSAITGSAYGNSKGANGNGKGGVGNAPGNAVGNASGHGNIGSGGKGGGHSGSMGGSGGGHGGISGGKGGGHSGH